MHPIELYRFLESRYVPLKPRLLIEPTLHMLNPLNLPQSKAATAFARRFSSV